MWHLGASGIFVWLLVSLARENKAGTNFQLVQNPDLHGWTCMDSRLDEIFSDSPIHCCAVCKRNASCLSAFYNSDDKCCILCSKAFTTHTETGLTSGVGSKYYYSIDVAIKKISEEKAKVEEGVDYSDKGEEKAEVKEGVDDSNRGEEMAEVKEGVDDSDKRKEMAEVKEGVDDSDKGEEMAEVKEGVDDSDKGEKMVEGKEGVDDSDKGEEMAEGKEGVDDSDKGEEMAEVREGVDDSDKSEEMAKVEEGVDDSDKGEEMAEVKEGVDESDKGKEMAEVEDEGDDSDKGEEMGEVKEGGDDGDNGNEIAEVEAKGDDSEKGEKMAEVEDEGDGNKEGEEITEVKEGGDDNKKGEEMGEVKEESDDSDKGEGIAEVEEEGDDTEEGKEDEVIQYFEGFAYFKIHAFDIYNAVDQCKMACNPAGCHVVQIETATENTFLKKFSKDEIYCLMARAIWNFRGSGYRGKDICELICIDCPVYIGHSFRADGSIAYSYASLSRLETSFASLFTRRNITKRCIALESTGNWTSVDCDMQLASVCERPVRSDDPGFQLTPYYWERKQMEDYRCSFSH